MNTDYDKAESAIDVFDYVIVGTGPSAIGILLGLLEEISDVLSSKDNTASLSIAIVERGHGPPHDVAAIYSNRWFEAANKSSSKSVKLYPCEIAGKAIKIPVGQGLGGSSNVNAGICLPPLQQDLESWPDPYRSSLVSNAKYLTRIMEKNQAIHYTAMGNTHNPFSVKNSILDFRTTAPALATKDVKSNKFVRRNYYDALLDPLLKKNPSLEKHLHWFRGHEAQRLLLKDDSTRVIGIECISTSSDHTSTYREIHAKKRVILCAGAIETPALLLVSELGHKEHLLGVGQHLMDQALLARVFMKFPSLKKKIKSPNGLAALGHLSIERDDCKRGSQIFQVFITEWVGDSDATIVSTIIPMALRPKWKRKILMDIVEIVLRCVKATIYVTLQYTPIGFLMQHLTTTTMISQMHPRSRGNVKVSLKNDRVPKMRGPKRRRDVTIEVDPKYLDDPQDKKDLKNAWDATGRISSSLFDTFLSPIFSVLKLFGMENFWFDSYCRNVLLPYYHFSGTCAMIPRTDNNDNPDWVVDSSLKVRGHDGLYICDASVFPTMISNPPALTCAALGYEFARLIFVEDDNKTARR
jgi:choline dehydrogenase-like flavoprotein